MFYKAKKNIPMFDVKRLHPEAMVPARSKSGDAGYDLVSVEDAEIPAGEWRGIGTGIAIQIPEDCYARIAPRSGLAAKHGIQVGAGVVDSSYRGEIRVILFNHGRMPFHVKKGDRIAQMIFERIYTPVLREVTELRETERGAGGFGSTGR